MTRDTGSGVHTKPAGLRDLEIGIDEEFARNRRLHGSRIQCGPGCTDCCGQIFQITEIEAAEISIAVEGLPEALRMRLRTRAETYLERRRHLMVVDNRPEAWGDAAPVGTRLPCPALEDGRCAIYDARPIICRKYGVPIWNPDRPGRVLACHKNFAEGDAIDDPHLIQIQTALHEEFKGLQAAYNRAGRPRDPRPISVARAIVEDFSSHRAVD